MRKIYFLIHLSFIWTFLLPEAIAESMAEVGESCETAEPAVEGSNLTPATEAEYYWHSYTMPREGKLLISSGTSDYLAVFTNNCGSL